MEDKELFIQYHELKKNYKKSDREYNKSLDKLEECLYSVLPGGSDPSKEALGGGTSNKPLAYTIKVDAISNEVQINRNLRDLDAYRLKKKLIELRNSKEILDKIYVYHYIDHVSVRKFCKLLNYSKSQIYRKIDEIEEKIKENEKMGQNGTNLVIQ